MNYEKIFEKKEKLSKLRHEISKEAIKAYTEAFHVIYAYNSAAVSGNSIPFAEAKIVLDDKMGIAGKSLNEIFELINVREAFLYMNNNVSQPLTFNMIVEIYNILTKNIDNNYLTSKILPYFEKTIQKPCNQENLKNEIASLLYKNEKNEQNNNPIEQAIYLQLNFMKLNPFIGYNDIIARLIGNHVLLSNDFLPISISNDEKQKYFHSVNTYFETGTIDIFLNLAYELEDNQLDCYIKMKN